MFLEIQKDLLNFMMEPHELIKSKGRFLEIQDQLNQTTCRDEKYQQEW